MAAGMVIKCTLFVAFGTALCCFSHATSCLLAFRFSLSSTTKVFLTVPGFAPGFSCCTKVTSWGMLTIQLLGWDKAFLLLGLHQAHRMMPATKIPAQGHQHKYLVGLGF
jgi:hypothetical protein